MTPGQETEFDTNGFLVVKNALSQEEVTEMRTLLRDVTGARGDGKFSFIDTSTRFLDLMARAETLAILTKVLGVWMRFDHAFGISMAHDLRVHENLHGGPLENQRSFWYQALPGIGIHSGIVKVMYSLCDVSEGSGGFICIPGSHKATLSEKPDTDSPLVVNPVLASGDMLIFTEALVHGSRQWASAAARLTLVYSYAPGCVAWRDYRSIEHLVPLARTQIQKDLLRPPFVGDFNDGVDHHSSRWANRFRTPITV